MTDRSPYALLLVQIAIGQYLAVPPGVVRARQRLDRDLGLDPFDVALIATALGDKLSVELPLDEVDDAATVAAFARCVERALRSADFDDHGPDTQPTPRCA